MIAAGGTAGHVLPSLAVAEALRERGVAVTFAGSPDRVEARLVPRRATSSTPSRSPGFRGGRRLHCCARCSGRRALPRLRSDPAPATAARRPRRRRLRRRADGLRGMASPAARRADGGGRGARAREPARGAVRAPRVPRLSDRRPGRRQVPGHGAAGARRAHRRLAGGGPAPFRAARRRARDRRLRRAGRARGA